LKRDFTGGLAFLEFKLKCRDGDTKDLLLWIGYCAFHLGNFKRAEDAYRELLDSHDVPKAVITQYYSFILNHYSLTFFRFICI